MNPLNPAASSLNAERARVDAGPAPGIGDAKSGGFADLLRDLGAPAKAPPSQNAGPAPSLSPGQPQAQTQATAQANAQTKAAAAASAQRPRDGLPLNRAGQFDGAAPAKPQDTAPVPAKPAASRSPKASTASTESTDEASSDAARTEGKEAASHDTAPAGSPEAAQATANDPPSTLAHWLLNGAGRTAGGDSALPPPAASAAGDEQDAAALTRDLLQGLRSGVGKGGTDRALGAAGRNLAARNGAADAVRADAKNGKGADGADTATAAGAAPGAWAATHLGPVELRNEAGAAGDKALFGQGGASAGAAAAHPATADLGVGAAAAAMNAAMTTATIDLSSLRSMAGETQMVEQSIQTPVGAAGFGDEVALSIATLSRGGVHEARLQLNPTELGPVSVHIEVVDGTARVDLGAAHAATRELLEAALPALAEAFKADGLTLTSSQVADGWTSTPDAAFGGNGSDMANGGGRGAPPDDGSAGTPGGAGDAARGSGPYGAARGGAAAGGSAAGDPLWSGAARRGSGGLDLYA